LKKENKSIIPEGAMVMVGVCSMYLQHYIRVISLVQKGRDYSEEDQRHSDKGSSPKESSSRGSSPKRRMALCH
jgi:predicted nucleic acid-binding Zn ribbon protein